MRNLNKYKGCLIGGAAGDALGYAVEFLNEDRIFEKYGDKGINSYELVNGVAQISDDTQMTLFTANGILLGETRHKTRGISANPEDYIFIAYKNWLITQNNNYPCDLGDYYASWLLNIPELYARRAPGNTCLSAISSGIAGTIEEPINDSKGCGGIMRVSPIALFSNEDWDYSYSDLLGAKVAALTHGHELGYIPAAMLTHIIRRLTHEDVSIIESVNSSIEAIEKLFPQAKHLSYLINLINKAIRLSDENVEPLAAIHQLGEGWVAEETLAIAVYCSLKLQNDFEKAIVASVNHNGDSDSTGAVTGNIIGSFLGYDKIPQKYLNNLELKDVILDLAQDLYKRCPLSEYGGEKDEIWEKKYIYISYPNKQN